jgi:hypothetical protein
LQYLPDKVISLIREISVTCNLISNYIIKYLFI